MNHRHKLVADNSGGNSGAENSAAERNTADNTAANVVPLKAEPKPLSAPRKAAVDAYWERERKRAVIPHISLISNEENKTVALRFEGVDSNTGNLLLLSVLGLQDPGILACLLSQITTGLNAVEGKQDQAFNFVIQAIAAMEPKDPAETFLCAQMAMVQVATMAYAQNLWKGYPNASNPHLIREASERSFNRLARTYTAQMQTLKLYRSTGKQRITVKHVTVNEGGQAIVGNVNAGGGSAKKDASTP